MDDGLAGRMASAAEQMGGQLTLKRTLDVICARAVAGLRADACGIFLQHKGRITVAALSSPDVADAEWAQLETDEGPCLEAVRNERSIVIADLRTDQRWPRWAATMTGLGWLSALSLPLSKGGRPIGSLNLFCSDPAAFDADDVDAAGIFARHASLALVSSRTETTLEEAIAARHRVGVAQGILMARYGLSMEMAFDVLRQRSQQSQVKLHVIASDVIRQGQLPATPPGAAPRISTSARGRARS